MLYLKTCLDTKSDYGLTLKCLSYFSLPFVHKGGGGGVHLDSFIFEYFPVEISVGNLQHMCIHPKQPKRTIKKCFLSKWRPKNEFSFRDLSAYKCQTRLKVTTHTKLAPMLVKVLQNANFSVHGVRNCSARYKMGYLKQGML